MQDETVTGRIPQFPEIQELPNQKLLLVDSDDLFEYVVLLYSNHHNDEIKKMSLLHVDMEQAEDRIWGKGFDVAVLDSLSDEALMRYEDIPVPCQPEIAPPPPSHPIKPKFNPRKQAIPAMNQKRKGFR